MNYIDEYRGMNDSVGFVVGFTMEFTEHTEKIKGENSALSVVSVVSCWKPSKSSTPAHHKTIKFVHNQTIISRDRIISGSLPCL
jgi:hypothetical protein